MSTRMRTWNVGRAIAAALVVALVGIPTGVGAEEGQQSLDFDFDGLSPAFASTYYTYPGTPITSVTMAGNIVRFDGPVGFEHIGVGAIGEGYVLCYNGVRTYDIGYAWYGFRNPTASCSGQKCTINRVTSDGKMRLTQVIEKSIAPGDRSLKITMTLKNQSPAKVTNVVLRRQADLDVDTGGSRGTGSFINRFASTRDSAWAWNSPFDYSGELHAVMLSHVLTIPASAFKSPKNNGIVTENILESECQPADIAAFGPVQGDYGASIQYNIKDMSPGVSVTAIVEYRRN